MDRGISGSVESRPDLNRLMGDAGKRRFDVVAVWRFDRFAKSTKHLLLALEEFRVLGLHLVSYQENIDTTTPLGAARCSPSWPHSHLFSPLTILMSHVNPLLRPVGPLEKDGA